MIATNNCVKYIQLDIGFFDNKKIKAIRSMPGGSDILVIWIELLVLAGQINDCGSIYFNHEVPYTADLLASQFGFPISTIQLALTTFVKFEMIDIIDDIIMISNWQKYQNEEALERLRLMNAERQRRYRRKEKKQKLLESGDSNVTGNVPSNVTCNENCSYISLYNNSSLSKENIEDKNRGCRGKEKKEDRVGEMFSIFYEAYGNKKSPNTAEKAFRKINPSEEVFQQIMSGIERYHQSRKWREGYRKEPATWLNGGCWKDEYDSDSVAQKPTKQVTAQQYTQRQYTEQELLSVSDDLLEAARKARNENDG